MSAITSMLVLQETVSLAPLALDYTPLNVLLLLLGFPLLASLLIWLLVKRSQLVLASRDTSSKYSDPTWIGSKEKNDEVLGSDNAAGKAALQGGPTGQPGGDDKGGASARW
jgi:hypothetical protein